MEFGHQRFVYLAGVALLGNYGTFLDGGKKESFVTNAMGGKYHQI